MRAIRERLSSAAEQIHHAEGANERGGTAMLGMVAQTLRRENEDDQDNQGDRDDESAFDIVNRGANRGGAVDGYVEMQEGDMEARSCGRMALMRSTVSIMLAPGCRNTARMTEGSPLERPRLRHLRRVGYLGNITEADWSACVTGNDELILVGFEELIGVGDGPVRGIRDCAFARFALAACRPRRRFPD